VYNTYSRLYSENCWEYLASLSRKKDRKEKTTLVAVKSLNQGNGDILAWRAASLLHQGKEKNY